MFHEKLGTVADKVERVAKLARWLVEEGIVTGRCDPPNVQAANAPRGSPRPTSSPAWSANSPNCRASSAAISPRAQGEHDAVADAIRDHYKPVGQGDEVPTAPVTVAVSLADKLDSFAEFFARRACSRPVRRIRSRFAAQRLALSSSIVENDLRLQLDCRFEQADDGDCIRVNKASGSRDR